jgi:hypothetical protein
VTAFLVAIAIFAALTAAFAWYLNRQTVEVERVAEHWHPVALPGPFDWSRECLDLWDWSDVPGGGVA